MHIIQKVNEVKKMYEATYGVGTWAKLSDEANGEYYKKNVKLVLIAPKKKKRKKK